MVAVYRPVLFENDGLNRMRTLKSLRKAGSSLDERKAQSALALVKL